MKEKSKISEPKAIKTIFLIFFVGATISVFSQIIFIIFLRIKGIVSPRTIPIFQWYHYLGIASIVLYMWLTFLSMFETSFKKNKAVSLACFSLIMLIINPWIFFKIPILFIGIDIFTIILLIFAWRTYSSAEIIN